MLKVEGLRVGFPEKDILTDISFEIGGHEVVSLIGANGCGKSTLLRAVLGIQSKLEGKIYLNEKNVDTYTPVELARQVAFLPQYVNPPSDMTVEAWVACGRYPYQNWWKPVSSHDQEIVAECLISTHTVELKNRSVASLSGGERQRVRIAMALAQEPKIIILDEPTTYLDLCHQLEVMELLRRINSKDGVMVIMVLHDINHAVRYSNRLIVIRNSRIYANGAPKDVLTEKMMSDVYRVNSSIETRDGYPYCFISGLIK